MDKTNKINLTKTPNLLSKQQILPESLDYFDKVSLYLTCSLCKSLYKDPVSCQACQNTYCRTCITEYISNNKPCPIENCYPIILNDELEKSITNKLDKIKIRCFYGCNPSSPSLTMLNYGKHLSVCELEKEENREVKCWMCNNGMLKKKDIRITKEEFEDYEQNKDLLKKMKDEKKDDIEIEDMCKPRCPGCVNSHLKINE